MSSVLFLSETNTFLFYTEQYTILEEVQRALTQYCAVDKIEKNEMGGACDTYGGRERCAQGFDGET